METSAIQLGFKIARGEISSLRKAFNDGESDIEKYNRHLDMLNKYFKNSAEDVHIYDRALEGLQKRFKQGEFAAPIPKSALRSRIEELQSRATSNDDKYASAMRELAAKKRALNLTTEQFNRLEDQAAKQFGITTPRIQAQKDALEALAKAEKAAATALARHKELVEQSLTPQQKYIRAITEISQLTGRLAPGTAANNRLMEQAARANGIVTVAIDRNTRVLKLKQVQQDYINKGVQQANALLQSAMTMEQRHTAQLNQLTNAYRQGAMSIDKYAQSLRQLKKEQGQENAPKGNGILGMMTSRLAPLVGAGALGKIGFDSIAIAAKIETATLAFDVMTGSAEKAKNMVAELRVLDAKTPISFTGLADASKTLMGYGVAVNTITPTLQRLSDISLGNEDKFKSLALAFGQVKAAGRLMGQEVLQMVNSGFNPLAEIAEQMAKKFGGLSSQYMPQLKKAMEDGQISFAMFEQSVERATSAGGRFYGMTERSIDTLSGQWAQLISKFEIVKIQFGEQINPAVREFIDLLTNGLPDVSSESSWMANWIDLLQKAGWAMAVVNKNTAEYAERMQALENKKAETQQDKANKGASFEAWKNRNPIGSTEEQEKEFGEYWGRWKKWKSEYSAWAKHHDQMNHNDQMNLFAKEFQEKEALFKKEQYLKDKKKFAKPLLPPVVTAAQSAAKEADKKAVKNFNKQIERIKTEYDKRTEGKDKFDRDSLLKAMDFNKMDATQKKQLQEALRMQKLNDDADIAKKAKTEADKVAKHKETLAIALAKKQAHDVKAMHDKSRTPLMEFQETLKEIQRLQGLGLNAGDAGRAQIEAAEKFQKDQNPNNLSRTLAPLLKADSVEAYKVMDEQNEKQYLVAEQQRIIAAETLEIQKQLLIAANRTPLLVGKKR